MKTCLAWTTLVLLSSSALAQASPPAILDQTGFFGQQAQERIKQIAEDIRNSFGIDLCIETVQTPEGIDPQKLKTKKTKQALRELREVAQDRADDLGVNGVYVMITTQPSNVTVLGWPAWRERESETSKHKLEELRKALARIRSKGQDADDILVRAVERYRVAMGEPTQPSPLPGWPALVLTAVLLGFWLLLRLLRRRMAAPERPLPLYQPAMLGNIFGVPAGFWIHDRLFYAERPTFPYALIMDEPVSPPVPETPTAEPRQGSSLPDEEHL